MPAVEAYGVEPIPAELRTVGWRDLFAINFAFFLNPVMYVLGAFAVVAGGLPLWWAVAAMVAGQALAFALLVVVAQPGVDYGLPGQVAMRATLGFWGRGCSARPTGSSPRPTGSQRRHSRRRSASRRSSTRWSAARPAARPVALALAVVPRHAGGARLRRDALCAPRRAAGLARVHGRPGRALPSTGRSRGTPSLASSTRRTSTSPGSASPPRDRDVRRVADARHERRRLLPLHAEAARHAHRALASALSRRGGDRRSSAATRRPRPEDEPVRRRRRPDLERRAARRAVVAIVVQGLAANITNVYTAGLSLVNSVPRLGRVRATVARRGCRGRPVGIPGLRQPRPALDHPPGQRGRAADRRHPGRLPARASGSGSTSRRCSTRTGRTGT